jgi:hypothetical protein
MERQGPEKKRACILSNLKTKGKTIQRFCATHFFKLTSDQIEKS